MSIKIWLKRFWELHKKQNFFIKEKAIIFGIILFLFILDRFVATLVRESYENGTFSFKVIIWNILNIRIIENPGIAFGMLKTHLTLALIIEIIFIFSVLIMIFFSTSRWLITGLSLVFFGSLGNILDHIIYGVVYDYFEFVPLKIVFNLSDIFISIGAAISFISYIFTDGKIFSVLRDENKIINEKIRLQNIKQLNLTAEQKKQKRELLIKKFHERKNSKCLKK